MPLCLPLEQASATSLIGASNYQKRREKMYRFIFDSYRNRLW
jgi:hypothetical protein